MRVDVLALQRFYASPLGLVAVRSIQRRVSAAWPMLDGSDVLGLGYATPYLEPLGPRRAVALMPAAQGAEGWPRGEASLTALADEHRLPFMDAIFDRVLLIHALEEAESPSALLREVWRVMAPEGRLIVIAANRWSLWAQSEATPFGHGRPYSRSQLSSMLRDCLFEPVASARALYAPPLSWGVMLKMADALEPVGEIAWRAFGGVVMMEAVKRLYAETMRPGRNVLLAQAPLRPAASQRER